MAQRGDRPIPSGVARTSVVIGNLKRDIEEDALGPLFRKLGRVKQFTLTAGPAPESPATAVVEYATVEDATRAAGHIDGRLMLGQPVTACVAPAGSSSYPHSSSNQLPPDSGSPRDSHGGKAPPTAVPRRPHHKEPPLETNGSPATYARYPPRESVSHEDMRQNQPTASAGAWERERPERGLQSSESHAQPPARYGEDHPYRQQAWAGRSGPPHRSDSRGPPGYEDKAHAGAYTSSQPWRGQGDPLPEDDSEQRPWDHNSGRGYAPDAAYAEHPPPPTHHHHHNPPPPPSSGRWPDDNEPRGPHPGAYHGGGSGGRPFRRMPAGVPRGAGGVPPHARHHSDHGYGVEDMPVAHRLRPPPPGHPRRLPGNGRAPWHERVDYRPPAQESGVSPTAGAPPPAIRSADFDKEVVRQAALLVAERELRAREEERKKGGADASYDHDATYKRDKRNPREAGSDDATKSGNLSRTRSAEGGDKRKRRATTSADRWPSDARNGKSRSGHGHDRSLSKGRAGDDGRKDKRPRRDSSADRAGRGRGNDRSATGRFNERYGSSNRDHHDGLRAEPRSRPVDKGRNEDKDRRRDDEKARPSHRGDDTSGRGSPKRHSRDRGPASSYRDKGLGSEDDRRASRVGDAGGTREFTPHQPAVKPGDKQRPGESGFYVHVGGLSFSTTFTTLAKRFAAFGDVNGFKVIFNNVTCRAAAGGARDRKLNKETNEAAIVTASTGIAFINFDNEQGMERAVEGMNNQVLDGHVLKVSRGYTKGPAGQPHTRHRPELSAARGGRSDAHPVGGWRPQPERQDMQRYQQRRPPSREREGFGRPGVSAAAAAPMAVGASSSTPHRSAGYRAPKFDGSTTLMSRPLASSRGSTPAMVKAEANGRGGGSGSGKEGDSKHGSTPDAKGRRDGGRDHKTNSSGDHGGGSSSKSARESSRGTGDKRIVSSKTREGGEDDGGRRVKKEPKEAVRRRNGHAS